MPKPVLKKPKAKASIRSPKQLPPISETSGNRALSNEMAKKIRKDLESEDPKKKSRAHTILKLINRAVGGPLTKSEKAESPKSKR